MKQEKRVRVTFRLYPFSQNPITGKVYANEDLIGCFQLEMSQADFHNQWTSKYHTDENGEDYRDTIVKPFGKNDPNVPNSYKETGIIVPWKIETL